MKSKLQAEKEKVEREIEGILVLIRDGESIFGYEGAVIELKMKQAELKGMKLAEKLLEKEK